MDLPTEDQIQQGIAIDALEIAQITKHYIIANFAHTLDEASDLEVYQALCSAIREKVMMHWTATQQSWAKAKVKKLYYFSIEWLPGRFLSNNIFNLASKDLIFMVLKLLKREAKQIIKQEEEAALGNGGLGRLASCYLDALATHKYPVVGYGLRYQFGIFRQIIRYGMQIETCDDWLVTELAWARQNDFHSQYVKFNGELITSTNEFGEETYNLRNADLVRATAFELPIVGYCKQDYSAIVSLRLFSTANSPTNFRLQDFNAGKLDSASELRLLTDVLYPSDLTVTGRKLRLYQEFLLASSGVQDMLKEYRSLYGDDLRKLSDAVVLHINDTHPALAIPELMRCLIREGKMRWNQAVEVMMMAFRYTNHTVLRESLEEWPTEMLREHFPAHMRIIERLNQDFCDSVRKRYHDEKMVQQVTIISEDNKVKMAHLAAAYSQNVNGVARIHSEILEKDLFKDFAKMFPKKFLNVTNGVTPRRFLCIANPGLSALITEALGTDDWIHDLSLLQGLKAFADDRIFLAKLMETKHANKQLLIEFIHGTKEDREGIPIPIDSIAEDFFNGDALIDVQIKRFHEYKRQLLKCLHIIMLYFEIKKNPNARKVKRVALFAGKAAPSYHIAKCIIRLIFTLARKIKDDPIVSQYLRVVFVENYNVTHAGRIIPAADLSEQISTAGYEASGTGCMKLAMNGALTIGTRDGANIEMEEEVLAIGGAECWPFAFGATAEEIKDLENKGSYNPNDILQQHPAIKEAVEALVNGEFSENEVEHQSLVDIHDNLLKGAYSSRADRYFVLYDLPAYYKTQKMVEELYIDKEKWAKYALLNIASMGKFSADRSVAEYAKKIWQIDPCPLDPGIIQKIGDEFASSNMCNTPIASKEAFLKKRKSSD